MLITVNVKNNIYYLLEKMKTQTETHFRHFSNQNLFLHKIWRIFFKKLKKPRTFSYFLFIFIKNIYMHHWPKLTLKFKQSFLIHFHLKDFWQAIFFFLIVLHCFNCLQLHKFTSYIWLIFQIVLGFYF